MTANPKLLLLTAAFSFAGVAIWTVYWLFRSKESWSLSMRRPSDEKEKKNTTFIDDDDELGEEEEEEEEEEDSDRVVRSKDGATR